jgi:hypothetical protein
VSTTETPFAVALVIAIRNAIRAARNDGTVSMSIDNLRQCVRPPSEHLAGAPRGTNASYFYAELFRDVCRAHPSIAGFVRACETTSDSAKGVTR